MKCKQLGCLTKQITRGMEKVKHDKPVQNLNVWSLVNSKYYERFKVFVPNWFKVFIYLFIFLQWEEIPELKFLFFSFCRFLFQVTGLVADTISQKAANLAVLQGDRTLNSYVSNWLIYFYLSHTCFNQVRIEKRKRKTNFLLIFYFAIFFSCQIITTCVTQKFCSILVCASMLCFGMC